jgi:hypothetical protein
MRWMTWRATSGRPQARMNSVRSDGGEQGGALSLPDPSGAGGAPRITLHARRVIHHILPCGGGRDEACFCVNRMHVAE